MKIKYEQTAYRNEIYVEDNKHHIVYTYYQDIGLKREWMLEAWEKSWRKQGWEPRILDEKNAEQHPKFTDILKKVIKMPTVNNKSYEKACYLRWVAMACVGGLMTDMDVININYGIMEEQEKRLVVYNSNFVPCMVYGPSSSYETILDWILEWDGIPIDNINNSPHVSDMHLFQYHKLDIVRKALCEEFNKKNLHNVVHCSSSSCRNENRKNILDYCTAILLGYIGPTLFFVILPCQFY